MDMASHSTSTASREAELLELALELSRELHSQLKTRALTPESSLERDAGLDPLARVQLLLQAEKESIKIRVLVRPVKGKNLFAFI
jgi:hypothetical protein